MFRPRRRRVFILGLIQGALATAAFLFWKPLNSRANGKNTPKGWKPVPMGEKSKRSAAFRAYSSGKQKEIARAYLRYSAFLQHQKVKVLESYKVYKNLSALQRLQNDRNKEVWQKMTLDKKTAVQAKFARWNRLSSEKREALRKKYRG